MKNLLNEICNKKKEELYHVKSRCSLKTLEKLLPQKKNRGFKNLLIRSQKQKSNNIIAEIKKSSPSAGKILNQYYPEEIALEYENAGVGAISILTEKTYFNGSIDHLSLINQKVSIPIIRKDFIVDEYQIFESKVYGADAILLIVAILSKSQIKNFINISENIGLDCLIETHNENELEIALEINYPIIGVNNRNLTNLSIDTDNTLRLMKNIPKEFSIVSESGIKNNHDIKNYNKSGIYNFLIGETILKSKNYSKKIESLLKND